LEEAELGGVWASLEEASRRNQQLRVGIEPSEPAGGIRGHVMQMRGPVDQEVQSVSICCVWEGASLARSAGGPRPRPRAPLVPLLSSCPLPPFPSPFSVKSRVSRAGGSLYPAPNFFETGPYVTKSSDSGLIPGD
jgi:hypothetical protein